MPIPSIFENDLIPQQDNKTKVSQNKNPFDEIGYITPDCNFKVLKQYICDKYIKDAVQEQYNKTGIVETLNSDSLSCNDSYPDQVMTVVARAFVRLDNMYIKSGQNDRYKNSYKISDIRFIARADGHTKEFIQTPAGALTVTKEIDNIRLFDVRCLDLTCPSNCVDMTYGKDNSFKGIINKIAKKLYDNCTKDEQDKCCHWEIINILYDIDLRSFVAMNNARVKNYVRQVSNTITSGAGLSNNTIASEQTLNQIRKRMQSIQHTAGAQGWFVIAGYYKDKIYFAAHKTNFESINQDRFNLVECMTPNVPIFPTYRSARDELDVIRFNNGEIRYSKIYWVICTL